MEERVDILLPPTFEKSGTVKTKDEAYDAGDWIGTFNLWIAQDSPSPALVYQQRSPTTKWAPGCLDVTVGGHFTAGENLSDGLREVEEELGVQYKAADLTYLGRKLHVGPDVHGRMRHNVVDIFIVLDNSPISRYTLQRDEVYAVCVCPIRDLIRVHTDTNYSFQISGLTSDGHNINIDVSAKLFPYNWDRYHLKMALIADRFIKGDSCLIY